MSQIRRISLFAGPGSGKSTTSARLFSELKIRGYDIEHIPEYIKTWAHEGRKPVSYDQVYVFGKQLHKEDLTLRNVQLLITDSPIMLNVAFPAFYKLPFFEEVVSIARRFDREYPSLNLFIERTVEYNQKGRYENHDQAKAFDEFLLGFLAENLALPLHKVRVDEFEKIVDLVENSINLK